MRKSVNQEEKIRKTSDSPIPRQHDGGARGRPFSSGEAVFLCCVLVLSLGWHAWLFLTGRWALDGDECYLALQGLDILKGARPVFYYGQNYMGCIEAYGFALFRLLTGASTPLAVKLQGVVQMLLYLASSYILVRRFFGSRIALYFLCLLAFPPTMLSLWYGKIRGYMPALLLGNCILYALFLLEEQTDAKPAGRIFWLLGFFMGLAWWANPLSIYYCILVLVLAVVSGRLRRIMWQGIVDSPSAVLVNGILIFVLMILVLRSVVDPRKGEILRMLYEYRIFVLGFLACLVPGALLVHLRHRGLNIKPGLVCLGFILGNAPMLFVYWTHEFLNLKQGLGGWENFRDNMVLSPMFVFPVVSGLANVSSEMPQVIFSIIPVVFVVMVYLCAFYGAVRLSFKTESSLSKVLVFCCIILLVFWAQDSRAWIHERYLLPLYLPLFILMSFFFRDLDRLVRGLGAAALGLMLLIHITGTARLPSRKLESAAGFYPYEKPLLSYCRSRGLSEVFFHVSDEQVMRLTFFSEAKIVFLAPLGYFNRIPEYEERFRRLSHFTLMIPKDMESVNRPARAPDESLDRFDIYLRVTKEEIIRLYNPVFF